MSEKLCELKKNGKASSGGAGISGTLTVDAIQAYQIDCGGRPKAFMIWKWSGATAYDYCYAYGYPNSNTIQGRYEGSGSGGQVDGTSVLAGLGTINITNNGLTFEPANNYGFGEYLWIAII